MRKKELALIEKHELRSSNSDDRVSNSVDIKAFGMGKRDKSVAAVD